jgi:hypothetical protein
VVKMTFVRKPRLVIDENHILQCVENNGGCLTLKGVRKCLLEGPYQGRDRDVFYGNIIDSAEKLHEQGDLRIDPKTYSTTHIITGETILTTIPEISNKMTY